MRRLHDEAVVVDAHHDIPFDVLHRRRRGERGAISQHWGKMLRAGGVDLQILPFYVEDLYLPELGLRHVLQQAEAVLSDLTEDASVVQLARTVDEVSQALQEGKIAAVLALEGCDGLAGDVAVLRILYHLGVRMVSFTWNRRNEFADGLAEGDSAGGLTRAGKTALKEMYEYGVVCDVSHLAEPGFWDVVNLAPGPFVASHSNARALCDHPRNLTDEQLRALAEHDGVVGINFYGGFVDLEQPTLDRLVDHAAYIADLVGVDHVGIGTDFLEDWLLEAAKEVSKDLLIDPSVLDRWVPECSRVEHLPVFTAALLERGFDQEEVKKVLGGNFLRVFQQVWP